MRLYAEDPAADYQPQSGVLTLFEIPLEDGIRVDAGYESGSKVSTHYDAMLAKVVAHAPTRAAAARKLAGVLSRARIHGVRTNRDQLVAVLRDPSVPGRATSPPTCSRVVRGSLEHLSHRRPAPPRQRRSPSPSGAESRGPSSGASRWPSATWSRSRR